MKKGFRLAAWVAVATLSACTASVTPAAPPASSLGPSPGGSVLTGAEDSPIEATTVFVDRDKGATLRLSDGAELEIPPGSLDHSQEITFSTTTADHSDRVVDPATTTDPVAPTDDGERFYEMSPSQKLMAAATLRVPYALDPDEPRPVVVSTSTENQRLSSSGEDSTWAPQKANFDDAGDRVTVPLDHFSGEMLLKQGDPAYLVVDLPGVYLKPGDFLMTLTTLRSEWSKSWLPGHVGMYTGTDAYPPGTQVKNDKGEVVPGVPDSIEAIGRGVGPTTVDWFRPGYENDHLYLGARRPATFQLSADERQKVVAEAKTLLGKPYSLLGDADEGVLRTLLRFLNLNVSGMINPNGYSCVGVVDTAYVRANRSLFSGLTRKLGAVTPRDLWDASKPVTDIEVKLGQPIDIPVYGAVWNPEVNAAAAVVASARRYSRDRSQKIGGLFENIDNAYDIEVSGAPVGATFPATYGPNGSNGYRFVWTPDIPGTYTLNFTMKADVSLKATWGKKLSREAPITQSLTITVR